MTECHLFTTDHGLCELAPTDRIVFTTNDREIGVKNGMLGTILRASGSKITVDLDDGGKITLTPHIFRAWNHGYSAKRGRSQSVQTNSSDTMHNVMEAKN